MSQAVRPLTEQEDRAYRIARLVAAEQMPYFMRALFAAAPLAAPGLGTFAVDRWWRLYADPALLLDDRQWSPATRGGVLLHEVLHLLGDHAGRADALPQPYRHLAWNYATDAEMASPPRSGIENSSKLCLAGPSATPRKQGSSSKSRIKNNTSSKPNCNSSS